MLLHLLLITLVSSNMDWKKESTSLGFTTYFNSVADDLLIMIECDENDDLLFFLGAGGQFLITGILLLVGVLHSSNSSITSCAWIVFVIFSSSSSCLGIMLDSSIWWGTCCFANPLVDKYIVTLIYMTSKAKLIL